MSDPRQLSMDFPDFVLRHAAGNAKCIRRQIGAAIFNNGLLVSYGWNEPYHLDLACGTDCPRARSTVAAYSQYKTGDGRCIAIHAEDMALRNADPEERKGGVMYITAEPCEGCLGLLSDSGLERWEVL